MADLDHRRMRETPWLADGVPCYAQVAVDGLAAVYVMTGWYGDEPEYIQSLVRHSKLGNRGPSADDRARFWSDNDKFPTWMGLVPTGLLVPAFPELEYDRQYLLNPCGYEMAWWYGREYLVYGAEATRREGIPERPEVTIASLDPEFEGQAGWRTGSVGLFRTYRRWVPLDELLLS